MLFQHVFWFFGHPEVYIMILPAMGIVSEVIPVFARKPIFGYTAIALSTVAIGFYSMLVWAHHMFSVGLPGYLQGFFMISSMIIAVPTGIKIFNWLATTWRGNIHFDTPMLFALGFIAVFTIGGLSGIFVAAYPVDWQVTDTYYVVAHLHYVLFGGSLFGIFAGLAYWWPKMFGRMLDERLGKISFWLIFVGMNLTFFPMHMLGLIGMPRRVYTYSHGGLWEWYNLTSTIGSGVMTLGILVFAWNILKTIALRPAGGQRPVARRHARVVHDLAAAGATTSTRCPTCRARGRCATCGSGSRRPVSELTPGPWLRLTALAAAAACGAAVVSGALQLGAAHRGLAALALPPLVALVAAAWVAHRRLLVPALAALVAFLAAALVTPRPAHLVLAGLSLAAALVAAAWTFRGEPVASASWRDYVTLTKPRIMTLLLLTGAAGMFVGARGVPPLSTFAITMVGLALACGGASALNHVLDRDVDRLMRRTGHRPVAEERVTPARALEFGLALSAFSFVLLASLVNVLTAVLALVGNLFYVLVYTRWLKRSTPQNIVIGGAAGAVPPLVGWAAATGNLTVPALFLFLIVFFWTPPHFWALALVIKRDYAGGADSDAAGRARRPRDGAADRLVLDRARRGDAAALRLAHGRRALPRRRPAARSAVPAPRVAAAARDDDRARRRPLQVLAPLPRAALRGARGGPADRMSGPELERKNLILGPRAVRAVPAPLRRDGRDRARLPH